MNPHPPIINMFRQQCWQCRLSRTTTIIKTSRLFSSGVILGAGAVPQAAKGSKTLKLKKKEVDRSSRRSAPGERKAFRKRVVLSNPNALQPEGMKVLSKDVSLDEGAVGLVLALPDGLVDQLRALDAFKPTQRWSAFRKPSLLWTGQSLQLGRDLVAVERAADRTGSSSLLRILSGEKGVGKSHLLLQAIAMALLRNWVVVSIPECE